MRIFFIILALLCFSSINAKQPSSPISLEMVCTENNLHLFILENEDAQNYCIYHKKILSFVEKIFRKAGFQSAFDNPYLLVPKKADPSCPPDEAIYSIDPEKHYLEAGKNLNAAAFLLQDKDNEVIAFACIKLDDEDSAGLFLKFPKEQLALLSFFAVDEKYRQIGLGKSLMSAVIAKAKTWGANRLYLESVQTEETAKFYPKMGFENQNILRNYKPRNFWDFYIKSI